jgi:hypothetical protein
MIDGSGVFLPESKRSFPSPARAFYKLTGLSTLFPRSRLFSQYSLGYTDQHQSQQVDVLSGAFLMVRKDIVLQLEGFDESFFMYGEDIDLSYRIQQLGYQNYYCSECTIIHFKGESAKGSRKYVQMFYEAMSRFVDKHYTGGSARFFAAMLHLAIWTRAGVSTIGALARRGKLSLMRGNLLNRRLIVVGNDEECSSVTGLLLKSGSAATITGRVAFKEADNDMQLVDHLAASIKGNGAEEIIFCGGIGYKTIIATVERMGGGIRYRFHGNGTNSIVGSDSKNKQGEVIASKATNPEYGG